MTGETLFALASAPGRAAIAVWRLSGPDVADGIRALTEDPALRGLLLDLSLEEAGAGEEARRASEGPEEARRASEGTS